MPIKDPVKRKEYQKKYNENYRDYLKKKVGGDQHVTVQTIYNQRGDAKFLKALAPYKKYG